MIIDDSGQELLQQLWITIEEKGQPGLALNGTLPSQIEALVKQGLAERMAGQQGSDLLKLTQLGFAEATQAVRRHRLAERLLADVLTTEKSLIDEQACRLEHALFDGLGDSICTLLGHPRFCPHGRPIPPGDCCRQMKATVDRLISPLSELQPNQSGQIAYIQMNKPQHLQKLMSMGVLPGGSIVLIRRFPSFVFEAGYSQFAVDEDIASAIYVRLTPGT